jgi:hypothetical protein
MLNAVKQSGRFLRLAQLMQIPDMDRRMLSQIVERWREIKNDLKRAALTVVAVDC